MLNTIVNKCIKVTESTSFKSDSILGLDLWQSLQTIHNSTVCIKHQKQSFFKQNKIIFKNPEKNYKYEHSNFEIQRRFSNFGPFEFGFGKPKTYHHAEKNIEQKMSLSPLPMH